MELNSIEDVKALNELQKINQIQRIEKKFHRLGFVPYVSWGVLIVSNLLALWLGHDIWSTVNLTPIAVSLLVVGQSNAERTDLLRQLCELKYSK